MRKPSCSNSDSECSSSAKSVVSVSENVSKRAVVSGDNVKKSSAGKSESKSDCYVADAIYDRPLLCVAIAVCWNWNMKTKSLKTIAHQKMR